MKKTLILLISLLLLVCFTGCTNKEKGYVVGICQISQHPALDAATQGFKDVLVETFGDQVTFTGGNAAGDSSTCAVICSNLVAENVDLILANATPALQAAASATTTIPVLATAITTYDAALGIEVVDGLTKRNISGTSDLAPLDMQAQMIIDLLPNTKTVGILYCSSEANSLYQVETVKSYLTAKNIEVQLFSFTSSSDVALVTTEASQNVDVVYIPTDNVAANCIDLIDGILANANVPIIVGEEAMCKTAGMATLTIDYYELGRTTGEMAVKVLKGEAKVEDMAIQYYDNPIYKFNKANCLKYNVTVDDKYVEVSVD